MNANYIKPIPKKNEKRILNYDAKRTDFRGLRFYSYLTTIQKELVKITVAIRNKGKQTRLIKQVAVHGVYSNKCLVRDFEYGIMGNYRVGWYDEGIKYPYNMDIIFQKKEGEHISSFLHLQHHRKVFVTSFPHRHPHLLKTP